MLDEDHLRTHAEIIRRQTCVKKTGFLAGPMTAAEADAGERATCVVASPFPEVASAVRDGLADSSLHVFRSGDLVGHEIAAALAAAYAIAMGITAGLDFGPGYRGLTLTRAVAEMTRFGTARGARASSFIGVAGLGALYAAMADETHACVRLGIELAASTRKKKVTPGDDLTREAVEIVRAAASHAKQNALSVPVLEALDRICSGRSAVKTEIERLNVQAVHAEDRVTDDLDRLHLSRLPLAPRGGPGKD
ncbi:MAG: hypothetical protein M5R36_23205 [Deltaproteobacteria bacterium]|nr:hypothetical protein [Deltaproteobacteria bacterium]